VAPGNVQNLSIDAWIKVSPSAPADVLVIADKRQVTAATIRGYAFYIVQDRLGLQLADGGFTNYLSPTITPTLPTATGTTLP
jgi:hypothetical protein